MFIKIILIMLYFLFLVKSLIFLLFGNKGFIEKGFGEFFFRKGRVGDWKDKLNQNLVKKIEEKFKLEMKELGYID